MLLDNYGPELSTSFLTMMGKRWRSLQTRALAHGGLVGPCWVISEQAVSKNVDTVAKRKAASWWPDDIPCASFGLLGERCVKDMKVALASWRREPDAQRLEGQPLVTYPEEQHHAKSASAQAVWDWFRPSNM